MRSEVAPRRFKNNLYKLTAPYNALTALDPRLLVLRTIFSLFFESRYNNLYINENHYEGVEEVILKDHIYKEQAWAGTGGEDTVPGPSTSQNLQDGASSTGSRRRYNNEYFGPCLFIVSVLF